MFITLTVLTVCIVILRASMSAASIAAMLKLLAVFWFIWIGFGVWSFLHAAIGLTEAAVDAAGSAVDGIGSMAKEQHK